MSMNYCYYFVRCERQTGTHSLTHTQFTPEWEIKFHLIGFIVAVTAEDQTPVRR